MTEGKKTLLILGKTGSGKSSTANSILGSSTFAVAHSFISADLDCEAQENASIRVVCAPDLQDKKFRNPECDEVKEVESWLEKTQGEPDAVILVIRCGERFTQPKYEAYKRHCDLLQDISSKVSKGEGVKVIAEAKASELNITPNETESKTKETPMVQLTADKLPIPISIEVQEQNIAATHANIREHQVALDARDPERHCDLLQDISSKVSKGEGVKVIAEAKASELNITPNETESKTKETPMVQLTAQNLPIPISIEVQEQNIAATHANIREHQVALDARDPERHCDLLQDISSKVSKGEGVKVIAEAKASELNITPNETESKTKETPMVQLTAQNLPIPISIEVQEQNIAATHANIREHQVALDARDPERHCDLVQDISSKVSKGEGVKVIAEANASELNITPNETESKTKETPMVQLTADNLPIPISIEVQEQNIAATHANIREHQVALDARDPEGTRMPVEQNRRSQDARYDQFCKNTTAWADKDDQIARLPDSTPMPVENRRSQDVRKVNNRVNPSKDDETGCTSTPMPVENRRSQDVRKVNNRVNLAKDDETGCTQSSSNTEHVKQNSLLKKGIMKKLVIVFTAGDRQNGKDLRQVLESDNPDFECLKDIWNDAQKRYVVFDNNAKEPRNKTQVQALMDLVKTMEPHPLPQHTCRLLFLGSNATLMKVQSNFGIGSGGFFGLGLKIFEHVDLDGLQLEVTCLRLNKKSSKTLEKVKVAVSPGPHAILVLSDGKTTDEELFSTGEKRIHTSFCSPNSDSAEYVRKFIQVVDIKTLSNRQALTTFLEKKNFPSRKLNGEYFHTAELDKIAEDICKETTRRTETPGEPVESSYDTYLSVKREMVNSIW